VDSSVGSWPPASHAGGPASGARLITSPDRRSSLAMFGNDTLAHDLHFERGPSYALAHVRAHSHERLVRPLFFLNFPTCTEASDWPKEEPARSAKRLSHSPRPSSHALRLTKAPSCHTSTIRLQIAPRPDASRSRVELIMPRPTPEPTADAGRRHRKRTGPTRTRV
jgi:hypothetical protein